MGVNETALGLDQAAEGRGMRRLQPPTVQTIFVVQRVEGGDGRSIELTNVIGLTTRADAETVAQKGNGPDESIRNVVVEFPVANSVSAAMEVIQAKSNTQLREQALARLSYAEKVALGLL